MSPCSLLSVKTSVRRLSSLSSADAVILLGIVHLSSSSCTTSRTIQSRSSNRIRRLEWHGDCTSHRRSSAERHPPSSQPHPIHPHRRRSSHRHPLREDRLLLHLKLTRLLLDREELLLLVLESGVAGVAEGRGLLIVLVRVVVGRWLLLMRCREGRL